MSDSLDQLILTQMPYFIARQYRAMLEATKPKDRIRAALRTYELGLRTLGMSVVCQYLMRDYDAISHPELNQLLKIRLANATLHVWQSLFFKGLRAYEGHQDLLFVRELYDLYWDTSIDAHAPRRDAEVPFTRLTQICVLERLDRLGIDPTDEQGWEALCEETEGLLRQVMMQFEFFQNYELIFILKREGDRYWYESHTGLEITRAVEPLETKERLEHDWFYLAKERRDFLQMHPMLIVWEDIAEEHDVAVYKQYSRQDSALKYITANLWQTIVDHTNVADFVKMMYSTLEKETRQAYPQLNWWRLREVAKQVSEDQMSSVQGKYSADLYLQRWQARTAFERFLHSDQVGLILTGQSGVGKSNFALALSSEFADQSSDVCLLLYDGARLDSSRLLTAVVSGDFARRVQLGAGEEIADIWQEVARIEDIEERKVVLIIDGINENPRARESLRRIDELVAESNWPWLKIVVTSRPEAWRTIRHEVRLAEARYYREPGKDRMDVELEPFSYSEQLKPFSSDELPLAYEKYRQVFDLQTHFQDLPIHARLALRDPLLLRLVADTYQGQEIPLILRPTEVYETYLDGLVRTGRLSMEDLRFLTQVLVPLMLSEGHYANAVTGIQVDTVITSDGIPLFDLVHNDLQLADGKLVNQSYVNLADAGVLVQHGTALDYGLGFRYERFYDYHAGMRLLELNANLEDKTTAYAGQIELTKKQQYLWGAVKFALIRELNADGRSIILALCREEARAVRDMMAAVLKEYGQENPSEVHAILGELMTTSTPPLPGRIWAYLRRLVGRQRHREESAKRIAVEVAGTVGFSDVLAQGASDSSSSLRLDAIRQIFYLWRSDRQKLLENVENRGIGALKNLGNRTTGPLGIPRPAALESIIGILILMFLETPDDPMLRRELQAVLRQVVDQVLLGRFLLRTLSGRLAMSIFIRLVSRVTGEIPRYYVGDIDEFRAFFELPAEQQLWLRRVLPYLDADHGRIEELGDLMKHVFANDDLLTGAVLALALVAQGRERPMEIVPVIAELFDDVMSRSPRGVPAVQYLSGALYEVLKCQEHIDDETWKLVDHVASAPLDKTRGVLVSRIERRYFCIGFLYPSLLYLDQLGEPGLHLWKHYLTTAVTEKDWEFLGDLLHVAGEVALPYHAPNAALSIVRELPQLPDEMAAHRLLDWLARIRFYYPELVDYFLDSIDFPEQYRSYVLKGAFKESLIQIVFSRFVSYTIDALRTDSFQELFTSILDAAVDSSTLGEWLNYLVRTLMNTVYGEQIFPKK